MFSQEKSRSLALGAAQVLPRRRGALRRRRGPGADGGHTAPDGAHHYAGAVQELRRSDLPSGGMVVGDGGWGQGAPRC